MKIVLTLIAERDQKFFLKIAEKLSSHGHIVSFITFYSPSTLPLRDLGFQVFDIQEALEFNNALGIDAQEAVNMAEDVYKININDLIRHEKITFNISNEFRLKQKTCRYLSELSIYLEAAKPDIVIQELGGFIAPLSLYYASKKLSIRHIFLEPMFFKGTLGFLENELNYAVKRHKLSCESKLRVEGYINEYKSTKTVVIPQKDLHHFQDSTYKKIVNLANLKRLTKKLWYKYIACKHQEYDAIFNHFKRNIEMVLNRQRLKGVYESLKKQSPTEKFVYFPLHVPLDFQLTVRSPEWIDQIDLLEQISSFLPKDVYLWVKEHPASIGAYSRGRLSRLLGRGNFRLLDPSENSYEIIARASAVITINSKVGAEALMQLKPVYVLGQAFYRSQDLCYDVSDLNDLKNIIIDRIHAPVAPSYDRVIEFLGSLSMYSHVAELYINTDENIDNFVSALIKILDKQSGGVLNGAV